MCSALPTMPVWLPVRSVLAPPPSSQILRSTNSEELSHIASHILPGYILSSPSPPFYLGPQAVNYAALDYLIDFTSKVYISLVPRPSTLPFKK